MASNEKTRTCFREKRNPVATAPGSDSLRLCFSAVIICLTALCAQAQFRGGQGWVWQNPLPQGNPLFSIHFAKDKENGFAVGSDNAILHTRDGGFSWQRQNSPVDLTLSTVFVKAAKNAVIVGTRGTILTTDDGGDRSRVVNIDVRDHLYGLTFTGEDFSTGWATGTYGRILKTVDGGTSWQSQASGTTEHILKIAALNSSNAVAVGVNGIVLTTHNGGEKWASATPCGSI